MILKFFSSLRDIGLHFFSFFFRTILLYLFLNLWRSRSCFIKKVTGKCFCLNKIKTTCIETVSMWKLYFAILLEILLLMKSNNLLLHLSLLENSLIYCIRNFFKKWCLQERVALRFLNFLLKMILRSLENPWVSSEIS